MPESPCCFQAKGDFPSWVTDFRDGLVALGYVGNKHANEGWKCLGAVIAGLVAALDLAFRLAAFDADDPPGRRHGIAGARRPAEAYLQAAAP